MKRSTKLALSLVLAVGTVAPAFAQDNFPDVPANHWAYEALARMKRDGLLVGYPDGLYRGGRPASRYELAVAMHAVYTNLKNVTDGLDAQIRALSGQFASQSDVNALKDAVAALQADVAAMKGYGEDIAALKRAAETFDRELKSLGVDVEAMKKDLLDLSGRVSALEKKKPAIEISGDVDLLVLAGNSNGGRFGLDQDGRTLGQAPGGGTAGLTNDLSILHEAAFTFTGTNPTGVKFTGTIVAGNLIDNYGGQSVLPRGDTFGEGLSRYTDSTLEDIYIQDLEASFDTRVFGFGAVGVNIGRIQKQVDPWSFWRIDNTINYSNDRWDNGKYTLDGANADFKIFGTKASVFAGRTSNRETVQGVDLNKVVLGNNRVPGNTVAGGDIFGEAVSRSIGTSDESAFDSTSDVDRILGVQTAFPLFKNGNINLSYLWMDSDTGAGVDGDVIAGAGTIFGTGANRLEVYGGDASFTFGRFKVAGSYHESDLKNNEDGYFSQDAWAYDAKVAYEGSHYQLYAKHREIKPNYIAPGDWGRLGILRNPANIQGFQFGGSLNLGQRFVLSGSGETDTGLGDSGNNTAIPQPFDGSTKIRNWAGRLDYKFSPNVGIYGSYESTDFKNLVFQDATARYRFATFGVGYGLSERAKLNVSYTYSDVKNEAFLGGTDTTDGRYKGGILTTQLTVKF